MSKAQPSIVHHVAAPDVMFTRVPIALIRDPAVKPAARSVILWFASQAEGRAVYLVSLAEQLGLSRDTVRKAITDALTTPYLSRTPTGGRDHQGNETFEWFVDLTAPWLVSSRGRDEKLATKKITKKINAKNMPRISDQGSANELTILARDWTAKPRHHRMLERYGLDIHEVADMFAAAFYCNVPTCTRQPRSSNWDQKFSAFIHAYADDRHEIDFAYHNNTHEEESDKWAAS